MELQNTVRHSFIFQSEIDSFVGGSSNGYGD